MKNITLQISFWAKRHRPLAISILIASKIVTGWLAFRLGAGVALEGLTIPESFKWPLAAAAAAGLLFYPAKRLKAALGREVYHHRQKRSDLYLAFLSFIILFFAGNLTPAWISAPENSTGAKTHITTALSNVKGSIRGWTAPERGLELVKYLKGKTKAHLTRKMLKWQAAADDSDTALSVLFTILIVLVAVALLFVVAALACELSCSGNESLAAVVGIVGVVAIIVGAFFGIRAIWRNQKKKGTGIDKRHQRDGVDERHQEKQ